MEIESRNVESVLQNRQKRVAFLLGIQDNRIAKPRVFFEKEHKFRPKFRHSTNPSTRRIHVDDLVISVYDPQTADVSKKLPPLTPDDPSLELKPSFLVASGHRASSNLVLYKSRDDIELATIPSISSRQERDPTLKQIISFSLEQINKALRNSSKERFDFSSYDGSIQPPVPTSKFLKKGNRGSIDSSPERLIERPTVYVSRSGTVMSVFILKPYTEPVKPKRTKKINIFGSQTLYVTLINSERLGFSTDSSKKKMKVESYSKYLESTNTFGTTFSDFSLYNPFTLDDPEFQVGKHNRTVITLPCFVSSIILYAQPEDARKELNDTFRETHPNIDSLLTLTQIRNVKARLIEICKIADLEYSSCAYAFVFFEKLVIKNYVVKGNRRVVACTCLLIAAKINDPKETKYSKILEVMEDVMDVSVKEIWSFEFSVFAALEFTLFVPPWQVLPHLERIMKSAGIKLDDYIGGNTFFVGNS